MRLPLGRPLRYAAYPFVQAIGSLPVDVAGERVPLVDDWGALASRSFDPRGVHPSIQRMFSSAKTPRMDVEWVRWEPWAQPLALGYVPLARWLANLCVPDRVDQASRMGSSVHRQALRDGSTTRRWERWFSGTHQRFYVAGIRPWVTPDATYLSMAFPMGRGQIMVLLRLSNRGSELVATTGADGPAGTFAVVPFGSRFVALPGPPTEETLTSSAVGPVVTTLHEDHLFGRRAFAVRYRIEP